MATLTGPRPGEGKAANTCKLRRSSTLALPDRPVVDLIDPIVRAIELVAGLCRPTAIYDTRLGAPSGNMPLRIGHFCARD